MKAKIVKINGMQYIEMGGKRVDPLAFKSFRPTKKNVGEFYDAGIRLFHVYCSGLMSGLKVPYSLYGETWFGDKAYDFTNLDSQIDFFKENAPDALVFLNVHLDTRDWWLKNHPGAVNSFTNLSQIAADENWRRDTADYLKALIRHTEEKYPDFVCGYFLLGGFTTEWFSQFDYEESHPTKLKAYREYLNKPDAEIPSREALYKPENIIFLNRETDGDVIEYRKFHNRLIADTVLYFCHAAQEVLNHEKLVGVFFGYILELLDDRLWDAGHIEFDKINNSPDIDVLATPSSYQFRSYDDAGAYMLLCETLEKHNKLCLISFDHSTYLLPTLAENKERICGDPDTDKALKLLAEMRASNPRDLLKTKEQTLHAMRREFMQKITKCVGYWWFDMLEGWFYDSDLMAEVKRHVEISKRLQNYTLESISQVAVFVSGESLYNVNKCCEINTELICNQRNGLAKMGAPYDIFSQNDLEAVDTDKYKFYIFLDAFEITDSQREFINTRLKRNGNGILFVSACDYCSRGLKGTEEMLGISLKECYMPENELRAFNSVYGYKKPKNPVFYADNEAEVQVLGRLGASRRAGLVKKNGKDFTVFYSALGNISHAALREMLKACGVHIFVEDGGAVFASKHIYGVYNTCAEETTLILPENGAYEEIFSGRVYNITENEITLNTGASPAQMLIKIEE